MATQAATNNGRAQARAAASRRRKRRRRGRLRGHFTLLALFLLAAGLVLLMTVFFKVKEVRVVGADKYDPDEIAAASGVAIEDNLLRVNAAAVEGNILGKFPYIETVEVRRKLPPAIEIAVTQCVPESAIRQGRDIVLINRSGKVLERGGILIPENVPVVRGIDAGGVRPGEYLPEEEDEKLTMLRYLLAAMEESGFTSITNVDLSDRLNIQVVYENRIVLRLGSETELAHKLQFVKYLLENELGPDERGTLDATEAHKSRTLFSPNDPFADPSVSVAAARDGPASVEDEPSSDLDESFPGVGEAA